MVADTETVAEKQAPPNCQQRLAARPLGKRPLLALLAQQHHPRIPTRLHSLPRAGAVFVPHECLSHAPPRACSEPILSLFLAVFSFRVFQARPHHPPCPLHSSSFLPASLRKPDSAVSFQRPAFVGCSPLSLFLIGNPPVYQGSYRGPGPRHWPSIGSLDAEFRLTGSFRPVLRGGRRHSCTRASSLLWNSMSAAYRVMLADNSHRGQAVRAL
ncbi:uncharacterized protein LY79DRAFT_34275 [Colletotrichum navitas]|uniref:Uncharacterized protein n=1 Tax=Colletotrichum navitas TaxID=681940 RepID=A0AAD8Q6L2_9PEZI|nr:uncharacterized protein LY79DRAFT_34275 [Colletotrichum navitas]KAK1596873.1 hypothetical protein LY79DRAFT_34275 [Colletotrichum navitas]